MHTRHTRRQKLGLYTPNVIILSSQIQFPSQPIPATICYNPNFILLVQQSSEQYRLDLANQAVTK